MLVPRKATDKPEWDMDEDDPDIKTYALAEVTEMILWLDADVAPTAGARRSMIDGTDLDIDTGAPAEEWLRTSSPDLSYQNVVHG